MTLKEAVRFVFSRCYFGQFNNTTEAELIHAKRVVVRNLDQEKLHSDEDVDYYTFDEMSDEYFGG